MPKTAEEAQRLIDRAEEQGADFVEARFDKFEEFQHLTDVAAHGKAPKIATLKLSSQGGEFAGTETQQIDILLNAAKAGFAYVDIDLQGTNPKQFASDIRERGAKIITSFHNFGTTPETTELNHILDLEIALSGDVCKIVTTANRIEDSLELLNFVSSASKRANLVCFAMGQAGRVSRLLSPLFGGFFTFASLGRGAETAPGQMSIDEMKAAYKLLGI
jgi:3-dehydroquinate dehydratase type I